ncbi:ABC transporter permease [Gemmatimonadota bacterium]
MDRLIQDLRYAVRRLANSPGFTAVAILSLAIGIGANTAIFSVVNAVMIREAPYRDPDQLVDVYSNLPGISPYASSAYPDYLDIRAMEDVFEDVGAFEVDFSRVRLGDEVQRVMVEAVSSNLFPMLGVEASLGRVFLEEEDDTPGEHAVAVLGHGFWQRAFGGDPGVLGRSIELGGRPYTIVGVSSEWFRSLTATSLHADIFVPVVMSGALSGPIQPEAYQRRNWQRFSVKGRLREDVSVEQARVRLNALSSQLRDAYPRAFGDRDFKVIPSREISIAPEIDGGLFPVAALLMTVVGLVLLLAATNLASILLARGVDRRREIAVRLALGAGRGRLVSQLLTETVLLALLGGAAGLLVAHWTLGLLMGFQPPLPITFTLEYGLDRNVLLFALAISTLAGILFGLAPAVQSTNPDVAPTLKDEVGSGRQRRFGLRNTLIAAQMTISVVLLVGGGLFLRSLQAAQDVDIGFSTREAGIVWVDLSVSGIPAPEWESVSDALLDRVRAEPGIEAAASAHRLPLGLGSSTQTFAIPGVESPPDADGFQLPFYRISPGFLETLGIPLVAGRDLTEADRLDAPSVVLVNEAAARTFWPGENPVGKEIRQAPGGTPRQVVGVLGDTKLERLGEAPKPAVYFPRAQSRDNDVHLVARGNLSPPEVVASLRRIVREVNPGLVLMEAKTMEGHLSVMLFPPRMAALLLGACGLLALALATLGLYGVVSFAVSRRTREVGIRMSMGADEKAVIGMVLRGAMTVVAVGGVVGLLIAFALAQLIRQFLFGMGPSDPVTLLGVPLLLGGVAALAAYIPARRASRVNPVEALRHD